MWQQMPDSNTLHPSMSCSTCFVISLMFRVSIVSLPYAEHAVGCIILCRVPELANVPASRIHEPWLMSKQEMQQ
jgi:hypothetical protein